MSVVPIVRIRVSVLLTMVRIRISASAQRFLSLDVMVMQIKRKYVIDAQTYNIDEVGNAVQEYLKNLYNYLYSIKTEHAPKIERVCACNKCRQNGVQIAKGAGKRR
mmetsp:Transcript_74255/g.166610  ORF Transcript_74255/g.166610 Transcript_74255/m.166610 type:complete len:106 (+) Transcript_74255:428-745(+)